MNTATAPKSREFHLEKSQAAPFEKVAITSAQERAWIETRTAFLYQCPAFAHILYTLMSTDGEMAYFTKEVPVAATDGSSIFINPETFFAYKLPERVFIVAHEVAHGIFAHCELMHTLQKRNEVRYQDGEKLEFNGTVFNHAADYFINSMLSEGKIGTFPKDGLLDPQYTSEMPVIEIYREVFKENPTGGGKANGFDIHLSPGTGKGTDATQATKDRNEQVWRTEVAAAMASAKAQGKLPASMARLFQEVLEPRVSWQDHIKALFARKLGVGGYDWRRPDRRFITKEQDPFFAPARSGHGADTVVVGVDTSGSIGSKTLDLFFGEMSGILEDVRPRRLVVIWCDAAVGQVDEVEDASQLTELKRKGAPGGGGTAFEPVFEEIKKLGLTPDALVYLTDGYGSFPREVPKYPVIWGSIASKPEHYPFGDVVEIDPVT